MTKPIRIGAQLHPQHGEYDGTRHAGSDGESVSRFWVVRALPGAPTKVTTTVDGEAASL